MFRILLSDDDIQEEEQEQEIADLTLEQKELDLETNPIEVRAPKSSKKGIRDIDPDEEELGEGSGFFVKRPWILGCLDMKKWILQKIHPLSIQNSKVRDQYADSLCLPADILHWMEHDKEELPNSLISHSLEVSLYSYLMLIVL